MFCCKLVVYAVDVRMFLRGRLQRDREGKSHYGRSGRCRTDVTGRAAGSGESRKSHGPQSGPLRGGGCLFSEKKLARAQRTSKSWAWLFDPWRRRWWRIPIEVKDQFCTGTRLDQKDRWPRGPGHTRFSSNTHGPGVSVRGSQTATGRTQSHFWGHVQLSPLLV